MCYLYCSELYHAVILLLLESWCTLGLCEGQDERVISITACLKDASSHLPILNVDQMETPRH